MCLKKKTNLIPERLPTGNKKGTYFKPKQSLSKFATIIATVLPYFLVFVIGVNHVTEIGLSKEALNRMGARKHWALQHNLVCIPASFIHNKIQWRKISILPLFCFMNFNMCNLLNDCLHKILSAIINFLNKQITSTITIIHNSDPSTSSQNMNRLIKLGIYTVNVQLVKSKLASQN